MKRLLYSISILFTFLVSTNKGLSQKRLSTKPVIDSAAIKAWPYLSTPGISAFAKYAYYTISRNRTSTLVLQAVSDHWQKKWVGATAVTFSADEQQFIYSKQDSLCFISLPSGQSNNIGGVSVWQRPKMDKGQWLAFQFKSDSQKRLVLCELTTGRQQFFTAVTGFSFDDAGRVLLLHTSTQMDGATYNNLVWVNLQDGSTNIIWSSRYATIIGKEVFDADSRQLAFLVQTPLGGGPDESKLGNSIWYYQAGMVKAKLKIDSHTRGMDPGFVVNGPSFSFKDGRYIVFRISSAKLPQRPLPEAVKVDVWGYEDAVVQSSQLKSVEASPSYLAAIGFQRDTVVRLEWGEAIKRDSYSSLDLSDFVIVSSSSAGDKYWLNHDSTNYWLISLSNGSRRLLCTHPSNHFSFSPDGRWLVYFDRVKQQYNSYEISTGKTLVISKRIPTRLNRSFEDYPPQYHSAVGLAGWFTDASRLLVYDSYDIWSIDPGSLRPPINLTNGYGQRHHISLRLLEDLLHAGIKKDSSLIVVAFDEKNKNNGFYRFLPARQADPEKLFMDSCMIYLAPFQAPDDHLTEGVVHPLKATNSNTWIVQRQSTGESPNYFLTHDFKTFQPFTELQPQRNYNWLTAEMIHFTTTDGRPSQAILYKPENFDPHKKYPVLFNYYEKLTEELYVYPYPHFTESNINFPWFVSRGYLVVTPDIEYRAGQPGQNALEAVVGAARYVASLPYVDASKMGIQGHSFGGFETNYIVTHTHLFAAACSASGWVNMIAYYGVLSKDGDNQGGYVENSQARMEGTPWQYPKRYFENSPILQADQVTTPLLLMANKQDSKLYTEGPTFFAGLRRLDKKVWMLQYDEGGHILTLEKDKIDFTLRLTQFFDHYLKGTPAPVWMTKGVPARFKGIVTGLDIDLSGQEP